MDFSSFSFSAARPVFDMSPLAIRQFCVRVRSFQFGYILFIVKNHSGSLLLQYMLASFFLIKNTPVHYSSCVSFFHLVLDALVGLYLANPAGFHDLFGLVPFLKVN